MTLSTMLVIVALLATMASLAAGVASMATDGEVGHMNSLQWMFSRLGFQAVAFVLIVLAFLA